MAGVSGLSGQNVQYLVVEVKVERSDIATLITLKLLMVDYNVKETMKNIKTVTWKIAVSKTIILLFQLISYFSFKSLLKKGNV